jgi:hypothetical protein
MGKGAPRRGTPFLNSTEVGKRSLSLRLDGGKAAENTARRKRMVLSNVLRYTVEEKGLLAANPLPRVD